MAGLSLMCGDCGSQLRSVEEAQEHAELTGHANFSESTEAVLNLICAACGKPCRSKTVAPDINNWVHMLLNLVCCGMLHPELNVEFTQDLHPPSSVIDRLHPQLDAESDLHTKRTGHTEFTDKTAEAAKPIDLEVKKDPSPSSSVTVVGEDTPMSEGTDMMVAEVNKELLAELESMGFPTARATRALHFSGNTSIEAAINWVVEHENDPDIDELPMVSSNAKDEVAKAILTPEEIKARAQELRERARTKKEEEEKRMEREREKERIRVGKELLEAKRIEEDNERKRILALRKAEKEEEKRAREKIRQRLEEDKAERRRKLGLPPEDPNKVKTVTTAVEEKKVSLPVRPATQGEQMRDQLRSLKHNHKDDDAKVKRAFQTLMTFVGNVVKNPDEEKYRKIRLTNPSFQERVGSFKGAVEFLELCGFVKDQSGEFLILSRDKVNMPILNMAGAELNSAIVNPFFGLL